MKQLQAQAQAREGRLYFYLNVEMGSSPVQCDVDLLVESRWVEHLYNRERYDEDGGCDANGGGNDKFYGDGEGNQPMGGEGNQPMGGEERYDESGGCDGNGGGKDKLCGDAEGKQSVGGEEILDMSKIKQNCPFRWGGSCHDPVGEGYGESDSSTVLGGDVEREDERRNRNPSLTYLDVHNNIDSSVSNGEIEQNIQWKISGGCDGNGGGKDKLRRDGEGKKPVGGEEVLDRSKSKLNCPFYRVGGSHDPVGDGYGESWRHCPRW
ncbi:unnamed protein product [Lupinus luteus]|uniref:Uncharacterized protein n=1 Tax=Lupinus luteus TaxID=3873 RepID=A0AAV1XG78_LUPLU